MLRIYDTAARTKVDFVPRQDGAVSMYVCGPTPYDVPHLGHGRTAVAFDTIRRYLRWLGYRVTFVSNVTDVEDRIIARAAERGTTEPELARTYEDIYWEQMDRLNVLRPDETPRATEFIDEMQKLIGRADRERARLRHRGSGRVLPGRHPARLRRAVAPDTLGAARECRRARRGRRAQAQPD